MHDADMGMVLVLRGPPVPAKTMSRALSERVQVFNVFPVGDGHQGITACSSHWHGVRFSKIYRSISYKAVPQLLANAHNPISRDLLQHPSTYFESIRPQF